MTDHNSNTARARRAACFTLTMALTAMFSSSVVLMATLLMVAGPAAFA